MIKRRAAASGWAVVAAVLIVLSVGCGSSNEAVRLSQGDGQALQQARATIRSQTDADQITQDIALTAKALRPLVDRWKRTRSDALGERILAIEPSAFRVDPATGERSCCDLEMLELMTQEGDSHGQRARSDGLVNRAVDRIARILSGHQGSDTVPGSAQTVTRYLTDIHERLLVGHPEAAARVTALARELGISSLASQRSQHPDDQLQKIRGAAVQYFRAFGSADGASVCRLLTKTAQSRLVVLGENAGLRSRDCSAFVAETGTALGRRHFERLARAALTAKVDLLPGRARMTLGRGGLIFLLRDGRWLIDFPMV